MINSSTIRAAFAAKLRLIPTLVALLGSSSKIIEFHDGSSAGGGDLFRRTVQSAGNDLLVAYQGTDPTGDIRDIWLHRFSLIFRPGIDPSDIFNAVVNGVPSDGSLPMLYTPIMAALHPMEIPSIGRRVIPVSEEHSFTYWEITTGFVENRP
jgi:hypothetical protein